MSDDDVLLETIRGLREQLYFNRGPVDEIRGSLAGRGVPEPDGGTAAWVREALRLADERAETAEAERDDARATGQNELVGLLHRPVDDDWKDRALQAEAKADEAATRAEHAGQLLELARDALSRGGTGPGRVTAAALTERAEAAETTLYRIRMQLEHRAPHQRDPSNLVAWVAHLLDLWHDENHADDQPTVTGPASPLTGPGARRFVAGDPDPPVGQPPELTDTEWDMLRASATGRVLWRPPRLPDAAASGWWIEGKPVAPSDPRANALNRLRRHSLTHECDSQRPTPAGEALLRPCNTEHAPSDDPGTPRKTPPAGATNTQPGT